MKTVVEQFAGTCIVARLKQIRALAGGNLGRLTETSCWQGKFERALLAWFLKGSGSTSLWVR